MILFRSLLAAPFVAMVLVAAGIVYVCGAIAKYILGADD